jgi:hypothetical protein
LFNDPYVHQYVGHWGARPKAKTVGVTHSSYRPILVLRFSSNLLVLWNVLLSLVTVGYIFFHPLNLGLLMLRGSSSGPFGQAKQCVINAFDTYYLMSADEVMTNILHPAQNMDEDACAPSMPAPTTLPPPISTSVAAGRGSHSGRGHNPREPRSGRGLPNKCSACGSMDHIMSSCTAQGDTLLKWTLAKRKMIV